MNYKKLFTKAGITSAIFVGAMLFNSCTPKVTPEQLKQLDELYSKEKSLTESIKNKRAEKAKLEGELSSRKRELKDCLDRKELLTKRLAKWPDIWPDWKPETEPKSE